MITQYRTFLWPTLVVLCLFTASTAHAQFSSGSTGSDGALNLTTPGIVNFDPRALNLDPDGDNVYHFTTITIGAGVTVRLLGPALNMKPVYWLASGAVQVDGTIDLSGGNGHPGTTNPAERGPSLPGAGGYPGGVGRFGSSLPQNGTGPGAGKVRLVENSPGGHAGYATGQGTGQDGSAYGNVFLVPLLGGSGGGGSYTAGSGGDKSAGGGAGGGALLIASSVSITISGTGGITSNGGNGGINVTFGDRGGGGSGGAIHLKAPLITGAGGLQANGGARTSNDRASVGRIRLEASQQSFTGTANPTPVLGSPSPVFFPQNFPSVRVVSVAGVAVPENPSGGFTAADVSINVGTAATVEVAARNVPLGTVVKLHVFSENGNDQIIDSTPLTGTVAQSTATIAIVFPNGFSRAFPRATWTP